MTGTWTWATVTQATPLRIKVDGDTTPLDATTDDLVGSLTVDDRVRVHLHADGIIVTGVQGGAGGGAADKAFTFAFDSAPYTALSTPEDFPMGITMFAFGEQSDWPTPGYATVETVRIVDYRTVQRYNDKNTGKVWVRMGENTGVWLPWYEQASTAYADALGTTAATANALAKRDANARIKAADGVAADDVATVGQLGDATASLPVAMATGTESGISLVAGQTQVTTVTFPAGRFSAAPVVTAAIDYAAATDLYTAVAAVTATGFTLRRGCGPDRPSADPVGAYWIAVQM